MLLLHFAPDSTFLPVVKAFAAIFYVFLLSPSITLDALPKSNTALSKNSEDNLSTMTKLETRLKSR